jgi:hypothetical protein
MALAKEQLKTQTPQCPADSGNSAASSTLSRTAGSFLDSRPQPIGTQPNSNPGGPGQRLSHEAPARASEKPTQAGESPGGGGTVAAGGAPGLPPDWPDARGFIPPPPSPVRPPCWPQNGPVLRHTQTYNGQDSRFTEALASYHYFQDDARFGGWQNYLQRSDDFIRFCCHMHIWEMLSARGGAGETRVVWRWPQIR